MHSPELRALFPTQLTRGGLLCAGGGAVGLVNGGAPAWELLPPAARAQTGREYHRVLLALEYPIDVFVVDQAPDFTGELRDLAARRDLVSHPLLADTLDEIAEYVQALGTSSVSRGKQVIWAVSVSASTAGGVGNSGLAGLLRMPRKRLAAVSTAEQTVLSQAVERARRLVEALYTLGGTPAPRLLEAEEIARLVYQLADPVRARRYPLAGALLDRVRRVTL
jgi:hypothetical protein